MAWLRIDDGTPEHHKLLRLTRPERWTWIELLAYAARQNDGGRIPEGIDDLLRHATKTLLLKLEKVGLLDPIGPDQNLDGWRIHDWDIYNGHSLEDKVEAYLQARPQATSNEVQRAVGGKRELVQAIIRNRKGTDQSGSPNGSQEPRGTVHAGVLPYPSTTALTDVRAAAPRERETGAAARSLEPDPDTDPLDEERASQLRAAGWTSSQLEQAGDELGRAAGLLLEAQADPSCVKPGALAWSRFQAGASPGASERPSIAVGAQGTRSSSAPTRASQVLAELDAVVVAPPPADLARLLGVGSRSEPDLEAAS